ncbi:hypothetical protein ACFXI0_07860 [Kitasatospora indigofera]|uniref:hypothetical protein n=1 Tax=Kitasatospora indigofera TaxID=67307 RepID=UPI0036A7A480
MRPNLLSNLHPTMRPALIELHRAKLRATVHPADGGGLQFRLPGPDDTFILIGSPEVLPGPDEAPEGFGAELYTPDGEHLDVLFHNCTNPVCCAPAAGTDPLNPRTMASAVATELHAYAATLPAVVPTTGQIFHRVAELIDADTDRTTALYTRPLGVPGCVLDHLTQQAVYGTDMLWFGKRYAALGREHGTDAVTAWTAALDAALNTARDLLRPLAADAATAIDPDTIRELADAQNCPAAPPKAPCDCYSQDRGGRAHDPDCVGLRTPAPTA